MKYSTVSWPVTAEIIRLCVYGLLHTIKQTPYRRGCIHTHSLVLIMEVLREVRASTRFEGVALSYPAVTVTYPWCGPSSREKIITLRMKFITSRWPFTPFKPDTTAHEVNNIGIAVSTMARILASYCNLLFTKLRLKFAANCKYRRTVHRFRYSNSEQALYTIPQADKLHVPKYIIPPIIMHKMVDSEFD